MSNISMDDIVRLRNLKSFPVCIACDSADREVLKRVYPLMQQYVYQLMRADFLKDVQVILFGSSLTMYCNGESDLDLAIRTRKYDIDLFHNIRDRISSMLEVECDILYLNDVEQDNRILDEINHGLVIVGR